jgi:hypothetical protein
MAVNNFNPAYNFVRGYTCAADIAANVIVKISTNEVVALATAATDAVMGVTVTANGGAGRFLDVAYGGQAQVLCGGSFTAGAPLVADGAGLAVGITPLAAAGTVVNKIIGYALTDGASGQLAILRLEPGAVVIS